jgi:hypothetical protein
VQSFHGKIAITPRNKSKSYSAKAVDGS